MSVSTGVLLTGKRVSRLQMIYCLVGSKQYY